jgi:hypothetical protein
MRGQSLVSLLVLRSANCTSSFISLEDFFSVVTGARGERTYWSLLQDACKLLSGHLVQSCVFMSSMLCTATERSGGKSHAA